MDVLYVLQMVASAKPDLILSLNDFNPQANFFT
jgi:hypothetical protein